MKQIVFAFMIMITNKSSNYHTSLLLILQPDDPTYFGRISEMRNWIDDNMPDAEFCPNGGPDAASSQRKRKNKSQERNKKDRRKRKQKRKDKKAV